MVMNFDAKRMEYERALESMWLLYQRAAKITATRRSGYDIDHVRQSVSDEDFKRRSESVAEHSYKFALLWVLALIYFQNILVPNCNMMCYVNMFGLIDLLKKEITSILLALLHDVPEGDERGSGDVPDTGSQEHDEAKVLEDQIINELFELLPLSTGYALKEDYQAFEDYMPVNGGPLILACKLFDKLEALFSLLFDEKRGMTGWIDGAEGVDNERDFMRAKYLGTDNPTDVWTFGLRKLMAAKQVPADLQRLLLDLLETAFVDTRGEVPYCLTADLELCD